MVVGQLCVLHMLTTVDITAIYSVVHVGYGNIVVIKFWYLGYDTVYCGR